jgi:hypothetical protein
MASIASAPTDEECQECQECRSSKCTRHKAHLAQSRSSSSQRDRYADGDLVELALARGKTDVKRSVVAVDTKGRPLDSACERSRTA